MKKTLPLFAALLLATTAIPAAAKQISADTFVQKASVAGNFEVETSKLALDKSQDPEIKKFAQSMIDDHTKASEELKSTLPEAKVDASNAKSGLDAKHQAKLDELKSASDFDAAYLKEQKVAHKQAIKLFSNYSEDGTNAPLKQFATKTLPTLKEHKEHLMEIKKAQ